MRSEPFGRLDATSKTREKVLRLCRLAPGEIWQDAKAGHRIGVLDARREEDVKRLLGKALSSLGIHDPPYNIDVGGRRTSAFFRGGIEAYMEFSRAWLQNACAALDTDASLYIWLGADQKAGFQPLPQFMLLAHEFPCLASRSFITLRNQRGYGTQKNWMALRQELLYYTKGSPAFQAVYTKIPKTVKGYYKEAGGKKTCTQERSRAATLRPGNVWTDIQQVFYRLEENVPGAYAQKPLAAIERIILASGAKGCLITDFFAHSGTTLLAAEKLGRTCYTMDTDPVFAELTLRRLEHYRATGKTGWQTRSPFPEIE